MHLFFASNPFFDAYIESDLIGKLIFISLIILSIVSWALVIYKMWLMAQVTRYSQQFKRSFLEQKGRPLEVLFTSKANSECPNAYFIIYEMIKAKTMELLEKNYRVAAVATSDTKKQTAYLSTPDVDLLESVAQSATISLSKYLDKHLYILSTIVTLAPFLGLLGTVYGILTTFSGMQGGAVMGSNQAVLGGLSLALTTTVVGLIDAIPALIGYNYLKNMVHNFDIEMNRFAVEVLSQVELHYRKVDLQ